MQVIIYGMMAPTASNYTISTPGIHAVTLDDGCDITSDSILVNFIDAPAPFSIGDDTLVCIGSSLVITLDPTLGDYTWQDGSNSNSYTITTAGDYSVTLSNQCGETSANLSVEEILPEVLILPVSTYNLCNGQTLEISLDTTLGPYVWQDGSISSDYLITTSGLYSVTMSHYCGPSSDSVLVTSFDAPVVDLGDTLHLCSGDTLFLFESGAFGDYTWQDGSQNDSLMVTLPASYSLTVENNCGIDADSVVVVYDYTLLPPDLGPDIQLCPGDSIVLHAVNIGADVLWQDGSRADTLLVDTTGTYIIYEANTCSFVSDTMTVFLNNQPPSIALPDTIILCEGITDTLDANMTGVTFLWNDGSQGSSLIVSDPGTYSLTVSNACGMDIDTIHVLDGGFPPTVSLGSDTSLCQGNTIMINPVSSNVLFWEWSDGSTRPPMLLQIQVSLMLWSSIFVELRLIHFR
jgi:hypothetical protein